MADTCQTSPRKRPKFLGLADISFRIHLPLPGKLSILHRVSGALLFLMLGPILYYFQLSLTSPAGFEHFKNFAAHPCVRLVCAGLIWAYMHHFCAGIRFLLIDMQVGASLAAARFSTLIVFAVSLGATIALCWRILL
ncbi:MAG: succinate dehydrogenase, cytochrome b556 subunit [Betaproteobacteria bacterium]|nr:succinate dehydrogenase, cytochrome b556 subunit [Betaproteobacteria bacterium]